MVIQLRHSAVQQVIMDTRREKERELTARDKCMEIDFLTGHGTVRKGILTNGVSALQSTQ